MTKLHLNAKTFSDLGQMVADQKSIKEGQKAENTLISQQKMRMYGRLAAEIWDVKLRKGNLPGYAADAYKKAMKESAGLDAAKGVGARFYNGAVGISRLRKELEIPEQATAEAITEALKAKGIDTEQKLHEQISGGPASDIDKIVSRYVGRATYGKDEDGAKVVTGWKQGTQHDKLDDLILALQQMQSVDQHITEQARGKVDEVEKIRTILAELEEQRAG